MTNSKVDMIQFETGNSCNSCINKESYRGLPLPTLYGNQISTAKQGRPGKPNKFKVNQNDIVSWYDSPIDFGGENPWDSSNSVVLCVGKTATATTCDPIWTGSPKNLFVPSTKGDWKINDPNEYKTVAKLGKVIIVKTSQPVKSRLRAFLEPRREYYVQCNVVNYQGDSINARGYHFAVATVADNKVIKSIQSSETLSVSDSSSTIEVSTFGIMSQSKSIEKGELMVAFGGNKKRDFVHVKDVSSVLVDLVTDNKDSISQHIFIHTFVLYKMSEIAGLVCSAFRLNVEDVIVFEDSQKDKERDLLEYQAIDQMFHQQSKLHSKMSFYQGIKEMVKTS
jgi:hypothetical protein